MAERPPAFQAIETEYAGVLFRSRLEARWAVFFDTLGIRWDYEPEGYQFEDGTRYVPDFWLPDLAFYYEVKPGPRDFEEEYPWGPQHPVSKAEMLCKHTGKDVYIGAFQRFPDEDSDNDEIDNVYGIFYAPELPQYAMTDEVWMGHSCLGWSKCPRCGAIRMACAGLLGHIWPARPCCEGEFALDHRAPQLLQAYRAARAARFWDPEVRRG